MLVEYQHEQIELPDGATCKDLAEKLNLRGPEQALAANINGVTRDLTASLEAGDKVIFWNFEDVEGKEVFWHTSAHVLAQAILRLWPDAKPTIGPPIKNGFYYDFANLTISDADFPKIEEEIAKILKENYKPERYEFKDKKEALEHFKDNPYKEELISEFEGLISGYSQGEFVDLCRGPHLPALGKIKAFKVMKTSGAYWRADREREMLTRIYGVSFPDRKMLKQYLHVLEEAKKRDHRILGPKLDLFSIRGEGPGMPFIHPHGMIIWNKLIGFLRDLQRNAGYTEIKTPMLLSQNLWETSGHWEFYQENMYSFEIEEEHFALKPMNCPGCMLFYKSNLHSYRDFPMRIAEFGHVHRHELSGSINGLLRVRSFHQDDSHIFGRPQDIKNEILEILNLVEKIYSTFGLEYFYELSTRPEKSIGTDEDWEVSTRGLKEALDQYGQPYKINEGDGAFYGPKIDIHIKDALGRSWQCGTIQLDMSLPEKFDLEYMDNDGAHKRPILIHRAIFGSIERFFAILIEHFTGKFPLWISPRQARFIPVAERHNTYAHEFCKQMRDLGYECDVDASNESVSKKVRDAQLLQYNYMLTVGDREVENQTVSLRRRDNVVIGEVDLNAFLGTLKRESEDKALSSYFEKHEPIQTNSKQ
ncbi:MAG: Threonine--tRNA ligase 2 [Chlamydiae bacterium]|nr:Threonine--tRNA ligase 2 [Chlamydiota bacterium]